MYYANVYYGGNDYRDYLAHYGVKGMKWGKHLFGLLPKGLQDASGFTARMSYERNSRLATKYGNMAGSSLNKWKRTNKPNEKHTYAAANKAQNKLASEHRAAAKKDYESYSKSFLGRTDTAIRAGSRAARGAMKTIRSTGKKIRDFAKATINAGKSLIHNAVNKLRTKGAILATNARVGINKASRAVGAAAAGVRSGVSQLRRTGSVGGAVRKAGMVNKARSRYTGSKARKGYSRVNSYAR